MFLGSLRCNLRCVAGWRMVCRSMALNPTMSSSFLESEDSLRCAVCQRLMCCTMALSCITGWVGSVVVVRELSRLHVALHLLRVGVFLRVLHAFWGLLRRVQVLFFLRTVLSCVILSRRAALHGHHNACDTHSSQNSYSVHGACGVLNFRKFGGRDRRWETSLQCTWGNKGTEYEYSVWGYASCCR